MSTVTPDAPRGPRGEHRRRSRSVLTTVLLVLAFGTVPVLVPLLATKQAQRARTPVPTTTGSPLRSGTVPAAQPGAGAAGLASGLAVPTRTTTPALPSSTPPTAPTTSTPSADLPDLVVVAVTWVPGEPRAGASVTFRATVRNVGRQTAPPGDPGVVFSVDGVPVSWARSNTSPLAAGAQRTYTADGGPQGSAWLTTAGRHVVSAVVDSANRVAEADEANNTATAVLDVAAAPPGRGTS